MKYYVYELVIEPDGVVCYVGKGSGQRMYKHRRRALQPSFKGQTYLYQGLRDLLISGKNFKPRKVFETDNEHEALAEERRRIRLYGVETLFNWGECHTGPLADQMKEARRQVMREARLAYVARLRVRTGRGMSRTVAAKISAANKGKIVPAATRQKLSDSISAVYGGHFTDEHRRKLSEAAKFRKRSASFEAKRIAALRAVLCGKPKDLTKARLMRRFYVYAIRSPVGEIWYAFSSGIVKFLSEISLPITTFYRALKFGTSSGWTVVKA